MIKKALRFIIDCFFKFMTINYIIYIILGVLMFPIVFIIGGFSGIIECYFKNKDLSYKNYKSWNKYFHKSGAVND